MLEIKRFDNDEVIHSGEFSSIKELVEDAIVIRKSLYRANLGGANLRGINLRGINLGGTNLKDANLRCCIGNGREVKSLQIGTYLISYTKEVLNIGCQSFSHEEWFNFTNEEIKSFDNNNDALEWWNLNKTILKELVSRG